MTQPGATTPLQPVTSFDGPTLEFDFPGLEIGCAEYAEGPTGCTVFHFPQSVTVATDVRGGLPGVFMAGDGPTEAVCFAGGSLYGLEACTGVAAEWLARRQASGRAANIFDDIAVVRGAIIFDFAHRQNFIYPDYALGRSALQAARPGRFPLGQRGAGRSAGVGSGLDWQGEEPGGQGGAVRDFGEVKLAVFTVVNAIGAVVDRGGEVVRGHLDRQSGRRSHLKDDLEATLGPSDSGRPIRATTLTLVVTNVKLTPVALTQLGRQVHSSMARAIQPFHTGFDGDVLFTATTDTLEMPNPSPAHLGVLASELAWDAVLKAVGVESVK